MKITVLMENSAREGCGLTPEHGLSFYIEHKGKRILLDAGSSGRFADNAEALGVDLTQVELAVLSHGHYDHADGLRRFFALNKTAPVYIRPSAGGPYFSIKADGPRFVGIHRDLWQEHQARFHSADGLHALGEGMWLVPKTTSSPEFDSQERHLVRKLGENEFIPDDFSHEQALVFETEEGLVVFSSCSHGGIVNIARSVAQQLPGKPIRAVLGGLHLYSPGINDLNCTPEYVRLVARTLREMGLERLWTGHCTGMTALGLLQE
ncbi:MAG: MBL fold metallo-hydrolase, partial [Clostridium sp.]|nr:MBL fold metallo-hydrolase [Clostridium sp.]